MKVTHMSDLQHDYITTEPAAASPPDEDEDDFQLDFSKWSSSQDHSPAQFAISPAFVRAAFDDDLNKQWHNETQPLGDVREYRHAQSPHNAHTPRRRKE
jgi:hypothetical protein